MAAVTNISKIQSESNSQQAEKQELNRLSCDQYIKDTIWKQFTTDGIETLHEIQLWPIYQRYNLKAIHNNEMFNVVELHAVTNISKIQSESNSQQLQLLNSLSVCCDQYIKDTIWKQFTTVIFFTDSGTSCDQYIKDTIWKQFTTIEIAIVYEVQLWPIYQRYNLKAIHNAIISFCFSCTAVTNISKIQSESNSQLNSFMDSTFARCDQYIKDTIWKQFTTMTDKGNMMKSCDQYIKDTIWKQFTTRNYQVKFNR